MAIVSTIVVEDSGTIGTTPEEPVGNRSRSVDIGDIATRASPVRVGSTCLRMRGSPNSAHHFPGAQ